ncbi:5-formyltetrahydrofolate cyclo-ligase [Clostridium sp. MSJ-4]|uniref:5-formyltetrahydrofolate cyclo-ligase n=1 Tax=Clostridium simiarum TaxID=2841506 RepID=A0ABS6F4S2_9CLOT|nr:5-formyltetrahydrofolate cyclo-ligase [Clostridium simiarum]MBU5592805.1 5-formyltetrahydrofolate cyclo-ligase [Clostridium simiarum]
MKIVKAKKDLRKEAMDIRKSLSKEEITRYNKDILKKVLKDENFIYSNTIFIYVSYKNEVDTHEIIKESLKLNKKVCVPRVISKEEGMKAIYISSLEDLKPSSMGILEPEYDESKIVSIEDIDASFIPGLAFDMHGGRLGYGGGFYDRFLKDIKKGSKKIALAYSNQILDNIPMDETDIRIDYIISNDK